MIPRVIRADHSDRLNGARNMHEIDQIFDWKTPKTTLSYSIIKSARLDDAFSEIFELEAGPAEGQSLQQTDKERRNRKEKIKKAKRPKT